MIPTMLLFGLVLGRRPRTALAAAAILWPATLLIVNGSGVAVLLGGAVLAVVNTGVGVLVHQGFLQTWRHLGGRTSTLRPTRPATSADHT